MIEFCRFFLKLFLIRCFCVLKIFFFHHLLYFVEEKDPEFFLVMMAFVKFFLKLVGSLTPAMSRKGRNCLAASSLRILVKEVSGVVDPSIPLSWLRGLNPSGSMET